jgi:HEXXH motif-containing protein
MPATIIGTPWSWLPDPAPWFDSLVDPLIAWEPDPELKADVPSVKLAIARAIDNRGAWLRHPCASRLTLRTQRHARRRDLQLLVWVAAHVEDDPGQVAVPAELGLWSPSGEHRLGPGVYSLAELGASLREAPSPCALDLDPWCGSVGFPMPDSWAEILPEATDADRMRLTSEIVAFCRAVSRIEALLPEMLAWLTTATRVVIPLRGEPGGDFHSGSQPDLPGAIYCDLFGGPLQILEALAHETAHLHLHTAAAHAPLVDPDHQGRYHSPLRPEPRPLRGILLACHALAYICAAFVDARRAGYTSEDASTRTLDDLRHRMDDAEATLVANRQYLTDWGNDFLERTREVCTYGRQ